MSNPVDVKWFNSNMSGAPALSGTAGALIAVLDACLINGFGSVTLTSLTVASGVATAVKSGHGFIDYVVVLIDGATPSALNGEKRITWIDANTFSFDATGIDDQTATGTITAKVAPAGWSKLYSKTNTAVYQRSDLAATAMLLRVDDTPAQYPSIIMYETMSDVDTGTAPGPTSGHQSFGKSSSAGSTAKPWRLFADSRYFFLQSQPQAVNNWYGNIEYGDIIPYKDIDQYHCILNGHTSDVYYYTFHVLSPAGIVCRSYDESVGAKQIRRYSHSATLSLGSCDQAFPSLVDALFHAWPIEIWEGSVNGRGLLPGLWNPIHKAPSSFSADYDGRILNDIPQLPGRKVMICRIYDNSYAVAVDITGPWR